MKKAYQSPRIKVIKIKTQQMLCTSTTRAKGTKSMCEEELEGGNFYEL